MGNSLLYILLSIFLSRLYKLQRILLVILYTKLRSMHIPVLLISTSCSYSKAGQQFLHFVQTTVHSQDNRINADSGLVNRLGAGEADEHVQVRTIALPDLTVPQLLSREQNFSLFIPLHRKAAGRLIEILMGKSISTDTHLLKRSIVHVAVFWIVTCY
jgi:hypothetical protein